MNAAMLRLGLGGADLGLSYLLPRLVNQSLAFQLLLTGEYLMAERAFQLGLFAKLVDKVEDFANVVKVKEKKYLFILFLFLVCLIYFFVCKKKKKLGISNIIETSFSIRNEIDKTSCSFVFGFTFF